MMKRKKIHVSLNFHTFDWLSFAILSLGVIIQLSGVWFMDTMVPNGLRMCCGHVPDNNLELAITNEIVHRFPPYEPGMFGVLIQNYHFWSHLVIGDVVRVFGLPLIATEYQYMTLLTSVLLGLSAIVFAQLLSMKKIFTRWFLFFLYFSGELTYLTIFIVTRTLDISVGSVENSAQFLMNYPRALAIDILMGALSILILWIKTKKNYFWYLFCIICGTLIGFKVYVGIFALAGLSGLFLYFLIKRKFANLVPILISLLISLAIYIPVNYGAGGLFFTGTWRADNYAQIPQYHLGSSIMALEIYKQHNNIPRIIEYHVLFFLLFVVSSFGLKTLGLFQNRKSLSRAPPELHIFLGLAIAVCFISGMFFMQHTGGANTFNFLVVVIIIGSFYAALSVSYFLENLKSNTYKIFLSGCIVALSIPRLFYMEYITVQQFSNPVNVIPREQLSAIQFLKTKTPDNSLILVDPRSGIFDYDGPYVSYLADRPTYYSGIIDELQAHGLNYNNRQKIVDTIIVNNNETTVADELKESHISYILLASTAHITAEKSLTSEVFNNQHFKIVKVK
jgi:hypothetical protein